jgi:hypothetical protein
MWWWLKKAKLFMNKLCKHERVQHKTYVGSNDHYCFCPDCFETFGGEETSFKKKLIADAAIAVETYESDDLEK